jgi:outer membrane protein assembly factor BamB
MTAFKFRCVIVVLVIFFSFVGQSQNWPGWRGPNGDGTSTETNLPVEWDATSNIIWKSEVPGVGHSSPIIWEDWLFTLTAFPETKEKVLLCYDSRNGKLLWQKTVVKGSWEDKHADNSHASGTPVTDGKLVYLSFLDGDDAVVAAYDFSGNQLWIQRPGTFSSPHGYSCSPILYKDIVIINGNSKGDSFLAALNKTDGGIIWNVLHPNKAHSFSTPIIRELAGKTQLIFLGNQEIASYNPDSGEKYWFISGPSEDFCSSPVYNEETGLLLVSSAWPQRHLLAVNPDGKGDVSESKVVWRTTKGAYYVPSPVTTGDYLFSTMTNGRVHCIDVHSGNTIWEENLGRQYSSPVLANGLVYMPNDEGLVTVIKPGPSLEVIAKNSIGERMNASPAISKGKIYLKGEKHLFCIGIEK